MPEIAGIAAFRQTTSALGSPEKIAYLLVRII